MGQQTSVFLRGMDSKRTLVLIDGIRYNDPSGNGANFEHLMINDIERIEVIKGAQSSIWGADASAGVINIITKSMEREWQQTQNRLLHKRGKKRNPKDTCLDVHLIIGYTIFNYTNFNY